MSRLFDILWVVLIAVALHKTLLPWLGLSDGVAITLAVSIAILGNVLVYLGLFDLLRGKGANARKRNAASDPKEATRSTKSRSESGPGEGTS